MSITSNIANLASSISSGLLVDNLNAELLNNQSGNYYTELSNNSLSLAQSAFNAANNVAPQVQPAFDRANSAYSVATSSSANSIYLQGALTQTNNDIVTANTSLKSYTDEKISYVQGINNSQNDSISTVITTSELAYNQANTATTSASGANILAQNAYNTANLKFNTSGGNITGPVTISSNLTITGNLTVSGNVTTVSANNMILKDNMIYLNDGNTVANPDLGIAGNYNDGTYRHAGFFRDASDGVWKVFDSYLPEPDASPYIDTSNSSFRIADFQANNVISNNITANSVSVSNVSSTLYVYANNSRVGIANTSPTASLTVGGAVKIANVESQLVEISSGTYANVVTGSLIRNDNPIDGNGIYGQIIQPNINRSGSSSVFVYGNYNIPRVSGNGNISIYGTFNAIDRGGNNPLDNANTGNLVGTYNNVRMLPHANANTSIYASALYGSYNNVNSSVGGAGSMYSTFNSGFIGFNSPNFSANVTNYYGTYQQFTIGTTSGSTSTLTNYYGIYLNTPTVASTGVITNRYAIYSADPAANTYFAGPIYSANNITFDGTLTGGTGVVNIGSGQIYKDSGGNVGIGTSSPAAKLDIIGIARVNEDGAGTKVIQLRSNYASLGPAIQVTTNDPLLFLTNNSEKMRLDSSGNFGVGITNPLTRLHVSGSIYATGDVYAYYTSDIKYKENIRQIPNAVDTVNCIGGKLYDWKDEYLESLGDLKIEKEDFGVIAQDVQKVFPQAVKTREDGTLSVDYVKLCALSFAAISELSERISALENIK